MHSSDEIQEITSTKKNETDSDSIEILEVRESHNPRKRVRKIPAKKIPKKAAEKYLKNNKTLQNPVMDNLNPTTPTESPLNKLTKIRLVPNSNPKIKSPETKSLNSISTSNGMFENNIKTNNDLTYNPIRDRSQTTMSNSFLGPTTQTKPKENKSRKSTSKIASTKFIVKVPDPSDTVPDDSIMFTVFHNNQKYKHSLSAMSTLKPIYQLYCTENIKLKFKGKIVSKFSSLKVLKIENNDIIETWDCENDVSTSLKSEFVETEKKSDPKISEEIHCTEICNSEKEYFIKVNFSTFKHFLIHYHANEDLSDLMNRINYISTKNKLPKNDYKIVVRNGDVVKTVDKEDCVDVF